MTLRIFVRRRPRAHPCNQHGFRSTPSLTRFSRPRWHVAAESIIYWSVSRAVSGRTQSVVRNSARPPGAKTYLSAAPHCGDPGFVLGRRLWRRRLERRAAEGAHRAGGRCRVRRQGPADRSERHRRQGAGADPPRRGGGARPGPQLPHGRLVEPGRGADLDQVRLRAAVPPAGRVHSGADERRAAVDRQLPLHQGQRGLLEAAAARAFRRAASRAAGSAHRPRRPRSSRSLRGSTPRRSDTA